VLFTFAGAPDPSAILAGWNGSAKTVTLRINENGANDSVTILNATTGTQLAALGSVLLDGDYADKQNLTASSTMTLSGSVVKVVLGTTTGQSHDQKKVGTMVWTTPNGTATESGPADTEF
jgi:large repetitive protein